MKSQGDRFNLTLQSIGKSGRQWDDKVPLELLVDESFSSMDITSDMAWKGSIYPQGGGFVLTGSWQIDMPKKCGRCNVQFASKACGDIAVTYTLGGQENEEKQAELELAGDEPEVLESPGVLNILDVLREHFWLAWQPMAVCSEACKGLCLQCGVDLNKGDCTCHQEVKENPFAALKGFKFDA